MFDRYIPISFDDYEPLKVPDSPLPPPGRQSRYHSAELSGLHDMLSRISLSELNSGDILLLGLFVFLLNKKADDELLIAIGLLLIL